MKTEEALFQITDSTKFEKLASAIIAIDMPELNSIIELGINRLGKTIKGPLDGFGKILDKNEFIQIHHTTTAKTRLRKKWLGRKTPKSPAGDLIKALEHTKKIKLQNADAKFKIVLTSNQTLDQGLIDEIYAYGTKYNLEIVIYEQSRIARLLNLTSHGQWLRKEYLGIEAELVSRELLFNVCQNSFFEYKSYLSLYSEDILGRDGFQKTDELFGDSQICFLKGNSGYGKSSICLKYFEKSLASGQLVLWLPENLLSDALSIEEALENLLTRIYPKLLRGSSSEIKKILQQERLVIIVDDVNRSQSPARLVDKLIRWVATKEASSSPWLFLCPVQPLNLILAALKFKNDKEKNIQIRDVEQLSVQEVTSILRISLKQEVLTPEICTNLAEILNYDPILIGIFCTLVKEQDEIVLEEYAKDIVVKYFYHALGLARKESHSNYLVDDYKEVLFEVSKSMLENRLFNPKLSEIKKWLQNPDSTSIIRDLILRHSILITEAENAPVMFRHDRLKNYTLSLNAQECLKSKTKEIPDWFQDPFYFNIIAIALRDIPIDIVMIRYALDNNPISVFEAIKITHSDISKNKILIQEFIEYLDLNELSSGMINYLVKALFELKNPAVHEIAKRLPDYPLVQLARLKNGDINGGFAYTGLYRDEEPSINDKWRDEAIAQAKRYHFQEIAAGLQKALISFNNDNSIVAALNMFGYFPVQGYFSLLIPAWNRMKDQKIGYFSLVFACAQLDNNLEETLGVALEYFKSLSDTKDGYTSERGEVIQSLNWAFAQRISIHACKYIEEWCFKNKDAEHFIMTLANVDNSVSVLAIAKYAGMKQKQIEGKNSFFPYLISLKDNWSGINGRRKLSKATKEILLEAWSSEENDIYFRIEAFNLWSAYLTQDDLKFLQNIPKDSKLFRKALPLRIELGDQLVTLDYIELIKQNSFYARKAAKIWNQEVKSFIRECLGKINANNFDMVYSISELMTSLPNEEAESLLIEFWDNLKFHNRFIQAAIYVGTNKCNELVHTISPTFTSITFEHVKDLFGFKVIGKMDYLTEKHLFSLRPFLHLISDIDLLMIAETAAKMGMNDWVGENNEARIKSKYTQRYSMSDSTILIELDELLKKDEDKLDFRVDILLDRICESRKGNPRPLQILHVWLDKHKNWESFKIACLMISRSGQRSDFEMLKNFLNQLVVDIKVDVMLKDVEFSVKVRTLT